MTKRGSTFTKGPWTISGATHVWSPIAKSCVATVSEPRPKDSSFVGYHELKISSPNFEEACRNADLIAAAPELYEALKEFMGIWNSGDTTSNSKRAQARRAAMWDKANAAIAKAEGRQ